MGKNAQRLTWLVVVAALVFGLRLQLAQAAPQYTFSCSSCHGMPPLDGATRDPSTGAFPGNHSTHQPAVATGTDCVRCHVSSGFTTSHMDGRISFPANLNNSPATAQYKIGGNAVTFKNQTSVPALGSCSNANCHFETATPVWGSTDYSSTADCSACHAAPGTSVPHAKHDQYYTGVTGCVKCHPDWATGLKFSHATSAASRGIKVTMGEGTYSGTGTNYLPSQSASRVTGGCSAIYCHSPGDKASAYNAPVVAPSWNTTTLNCAGCHKADAASGNAITSPAAGYGHAKHVSSTITAQIGCVKCHGATVSNNTTIGSRADHVDKFVTIKFNSSTTAVNGSYNGNNASTLAYKKTPGTAFGSCQNVYCHSNGTTAAAPFATMSTARWGSPLAANCTGCHGGDSTRPANRQMASGKHSKHIAGGTGNYAYGCADCHAQTASGNTTVGTPANHVDYKVNVDFAANWGGTYSANAHKPGAASGNCSSVYCHSDGKKTGSTYVNQAWNASLPGDCSGCHGTATSNTLSGKHQAHVNNAAVIGTNFGCVDCHALTVSGNTTISNASKHVNKFRDYSGTKARGTANYATGTCSSLYCHSDGKGVFKPMSSANWFSARALDCKGCHGSNNPAAFTSVAGEPNYASAGAAQPRANSHSKHVASAADCVKCHRKTTSTGASIIAGSTDHIDGNIDARFSKVSAFANMSGTYNQTAKTCSATYCHGTAASPAWGDTTGTKCNTCHANQGAGTQTPVVVNGAHGKHTAWETAGNYNYACEMCHSNKASSPATHASGPVSTNQVAEVVFYNGAFTNWTSTAYGDETAKKYKYRALNSSPYGAIAPTPSYTAGGTVGGTDNGMNWTNGSCSTVWCHSNANPVGGTNNYQTSLSWNTTITCASCHGSTGTTGGTNLSSVHDKHINTFGYTCDKCHVNTTATGNNGALNATTGLANHVNGVKDVKFDSTNPSGTYASFTCSATYCHSDGKGNSYNVAWNNSASGACGTCHKVSTTTVNGLINSKAHFAHFSTTYGPKFVKTDASQCSQCHTYSTETAATHLNGAVDVTSTCTTNCHRQILPANITTAWGAGQVTCESCHTGTLSIISGVTAPDKSPFATAGHGKISTGKLGKNCVDCHDRGQKHISGTLGDTNRVFSGLGTGDTIQACTYCHNDATKVTNAQFRNMSTHFTTLNGPQDMTCQYCHDPHGATGNLSMIAAKVKFNTFSASIFFTNLSTGMINTSNNRGLCQVCHSQTKYYKNGVAEASHPTKNCFSCHSHNAKGGAFQASGNCDSCHGYPPVPRQTATAFTFGRLGNYTSAKFEDYSGGGGAHVVDMHVPKTVKATDGWTPCLTCHNSGDSSHKMITPIRSNVSNVTITMKQNYKKYNVSQFVTYSGAKLNNPPQRNVTGTCYNSSCHFKPSPRWSTER